MSIPEKCQAHDQSAGRHRGERGRRCRPDAVSDDCAVCHGSDGRGRDQRPAAGSIRRPPTCSRQPTRPAHRRRAVLLHPQWHPEHRHAGLAAARRARPGSWSPTCAICPSPRRPARHAGACATRLAAHYVGSAACKTCHQRPFTSDGRRPRWPTWCAIRNEHPEAIIPDLSKPDPLVTFTKDDIAFVYGSKWKQRYFKKVGDDYFPLPGAVGRDAQEVEALLREGRLVGALLSAGQFAAPDRPALRRLPLGRTTTSRPRRVTEWNVGCEKCHGPGQRAREAARSPPTSSIRRGWTTCRPTTPASSATPRAGRSSNPIDGKYYDWPVGYDVGRKLQRLLEAGGAQARRDDLHPLRRRHGAQEPHAGQRLRHEPDVHARRDLLHLPRRRTARVTTRTCCEAGQCRCASTATAPVRPNGPHAPTHRAAHPSPGRQRRQRVHRLPHAEDRADHRRRERAQPHLPLRQPGHDRSR